MSSDKIETEDPPLIQRQIETDCGIIPVRDRELSDDTVIDSVTFEIEDGSETTISVNDIFVTDSGTIVGKVDLIYISVSDVRLDDNNYQTHWVNIDYRCGNHHDSFGSGGVGGIPLGEAAKQISNGSMLPI